MQTTERNGNLVGAVQVFDGEEIMLISDQGTMVRTRVDEVSVLGRNTQGVRLIKLKEGERMQGLERIEESADETVKRELAHGSVAEGEEAVDDSLVDDVIDDSAAEAEDTNDE